MLNFETKTTTRYTAKVDDVTVRITETLGSEKRVLLEAFKGKSYQNTMYFVVSSVEEAEALAKKMVEFFIENNPVLVEPSKDDDLDTCEES